MTMIRCSLILILIAAVSACGFHLRGSERPISKTFSSIHLVVSGNDQSFQSALKSTLQDADIELNDASINRLEILSTRDQKRTASYSSRAKSAEYELIKTVTFRVTREKEQLIEPMKLETRRSYLYRETAAVGKAEEEILLKQEMDHDLAQRILLALQRTADRQREQSQAQEHRQEVPLEAAP
jgi:LPS-assembly lipoprotein